MVAEWQPSQRSGEEERRRRGASVVPGLQSATPIQPGSHLFINARKEKKTPNEHKQKMRAGAFACHWCTRENTEKNKDIFIDNSFLLTHTILPTHTERKWFSQSGFWLFTTSEWLLIVDAVTFGERSRLWGSNRLQRWATRRRLWTGREVGGWRLSLSASRYKVSFKRCQMKW